MSVTSRRAFLHASAGGAVVLAASACTTSAAVGTAAAEVPGPPAAAQAVMDGPRYAISRWFLHVSDRETGEALMELNADQLVLPASTTKLWSTAAALDTFGPGFRFETPVYRRGTLAGDTLTGDLVLVATGDMTMGGRTLPDGTIAFTPLDHAEANDLPGATLTDPDPLAGLDELARQVAATGIRRVQGDVLIDARLYEQTDKDGYVLSPIIVNDNLVDVTVTAGVAGVTVQTRPETAAYTVRSTVTVGEGSPTAKEVEPGVIEVSGQIAPGSPVLRTVHVTDPPSFARTLFIEALARAGVAVSAAPTGPNPEAALPPEGSLTDRVALLTSPPFSEYVKLINKVSMNYHADTQILLLAAKAGKKTFDDGMALLGPFVESLGIDPKTLMLADGRGNSYTDLFTPQTCGELLRAMAKRPDFGAYFASMPVYGVDGTESTVVPANSPAKGQVAAKSGTTVAGDLMNGRGVVMTRGNAGYMTSKSGRRLVVAAYVMHTPIGAIEDVFEVARDVASVVVAAWEAT